MGGEKGFLSLLSAVSLSNILPCHKQRKLFQFVLDARNRIKSKDGGVGEYQKQIRGMLQ